MSSLYHILIKYAHFYISSALPPPTQQQGIDDLSGRRRLLPLVTLHRPRQGDLATGLVAECVTEATK